MWYIRATMFVFNNNLQKKSFKKSFVWKSEKKLKKNSQSFHKVISTTPLNNLHMHYNMEGVGKWFYVLHAHYEFPMNWLLWYWDYKKIVTCKYFSFSLHFVPYQKNHIQISMKDVFFGFFHLNHNLHFQNMFKQRISNIYLGSSITWN